MTDTRTETDTFGPIEVAADRYWGAQAQRSLGNFKIGWEKQPASIVRALGIVKRAAAELHVGFGRSALDDAQRADDRLGLLFPADLEVAEAALRLRAPIDFVGDLDAAKGVGFGARAGHAHVLKVESRRFSRTPPLRKAYTDAHGRKRGGMDRQGQGAGA